MILLIGGRSFTDPHGRLRPSALTAVADASATRADDAGKGVGYARRTECIVGL